MPFWGSSNIDAGDLKCSRSAKPKTTNKPYSQGVMNEKVIALLETERSRLQQELAKVEEAIRVLSDSADSAPSRKSGAGTKGKSGKRVSKQDLEDAILTAIGGNKKSHAEIKASEPVKKAYGTRKVPNLFIKLDSLIKEGRLKKTGKLKAATYALHK